MESSAKATIDQPRASTEMKVMNAPAAPSKQHVECQHKHKASRVRGGGAGKLLTLLRLARTALWVLSAASYASSAVRDAATALAILSVAHVRCAAEGDFFTTAISFGPLTTV